MEKVELVVPNDYSEYWGAQILLVRYLQQMGVRTDVKDRLPIFRLWQIIQSRMTGKRAEHLLQLLNKLTQLRLNGMEPPHKDGKYL